MMNDANRRVSEDALFGDSDAMARVLLSMLSEEQYSAVRNYFYSKSASTIDVEMRSMRELDGIPGVVTFMTGMSAKEAYHTLLGMTLVSAGVMGSDADVDDYEEILIKGVGFGSEAARHIAEQVMAGEGNPSFGDNFGTWVAESLASFNNWLRGGPAATGIAQVAANAVRQKAAALLEGGSKVATNVVQWMRLGELVQKKWREDRVRAMGTGYEAAVKAGNAAMLEDYVPSVAAAVGNPFDIESGHYGYAGDGIPHTIETLAAQAAGVPVVVDEQGNPVETGESEQIAARMALGQLIEDLDRLKLTPYHMYALRNPEEGGLFSGIAKAFKKATKFATGLARKALPGALSGIGTALGGPVGGLVAQQFAPQVSGALFGRPRGRALPAMALPQLTANLARRTSAVHRATGVPLYAARPDLARVMAELHQILSQG